MSHISGVGTDIVEIARIEASLKRSLGLAKKVLTSREYDDFAAANFAPAFLAKRFAAKEAFAKALGTGFSNGVSWCDIEVQHTQLGQPGFAVQGTTRELLLQKQVKTIHLSLSDERHYATAMVVMTASAASFQQDDDFIGY